MSCQLPLNAWTYWSRDCAPTMVASDNTQAAANIVVKTLATFMAPPLLSRRDLCPADHPAVLPENHPDGNAVTFGKRQCGSGNVLGLTGGEAQRAVLARGHCARATGTVDLNGALDLGYFKADGRCGDLKTGFRGFDGDGGDRNNGAFALCCGVDCTAGGGKTHNECGCVAHR